MVSLQATFKPERGCKAPHHTYLLGMASVALAHTSPAGSAWGAIGLELGAGPVFGLPVRGIQN